MKARLLILMFLFYLISCSNQNHSTQAPIRNSFAWDKWLEQPDCYPPCWVNITPGKTTIENALSTLENLPDVIITFQSQDMVGWEYKNPRSGAGTLIAYQGVITGIRVGVPPSENLELSKIFNVYHYPDYVNLYDCREGMCSTILVYIDEGMILGIYVPNYGSENVPRIEIASKSIVNDVWFFPSGMDGFKKSAFQNIDLLTAWKGYGIYP